MLLFILNVGYSHDTGACHSVSLVRLEHADYIELCPVAPGTATRTINNGDASTHESGELEIVLNTAGATVTQNLIALHATPKTFTQAMGRSLESPTHNRAPCHSGMVCMCPAVLK